MQNLLVCFKQIDNQYGLLLELKAEIRLAGISTVIGFTLAALTVFLYFGTPLSLSVMPTVMGKMLLALGGHCLGRVIGIARIINKRRDQLPEGTVLRSHVETVTLNAPTPELNLASQPPKPLLCLLNILTPPKQRDGIEGDAVESYQRMVKKFGVRAANIDLCIHLSSLVWPRISGLIRFVFRFIAG